MIKWLLLGVGAVIAIVAVVMVIKIMLKSEKDSKKIKTQEVAGKPQEYIPEQAPINIHSASGAIPITDLSSKPTQFVEPASDLIDDVPDIPMGGFMDEADDEFGDFSNFAHNLKGRRRQPPTDFDLEGDLADEYIPDGPDFSYIPKRRQPKNKSTTSINDLTTEMKVLMLSDIFDRKF